jgi:hypothetical protein
MIHRNLKPGSLLCDRRPLLYNQADENLLVNTRRQSSYRWAGVTACLLGASFAFAGHAQEAKRELLVEHVSPSILAAPIASTNSIALLDAANPMDEEEAAHFMNRPSRKLTEGERWEKFEAEFGLSQKSPSFIKGSVESTKYRLDRTTFILNEFVQNVENALSFDYGLRPAGGPNGTNTIRRGAASSPIPLWDAVQNARFKSDIDLNVPGGRAFLGVRLVLPIGD